MSVSTEHLLTYDIGHELDETIVQNKTEYLGLSRMSLFIVLALCHQGLGVINLAMTLPYGSQ